MNQETVKRKRSTLRKILTLLAVVMIGVTVWIALPLINQGGGPNQPDQLILAKYDTDADGVLNTAERAVARSEVQSSSRGPRRGPPVDNQSGGTPGIKLSPAEVASFPDANLYDREVMRTLFIDFEADDWEQELADFKPTDVEVPAQLTVDGEVYPDVGLSFRGASSFFTIPAGLKRSLNISMDLIDDKQRLYGYKTLNLLNCNGDASMMSSALYSDVSRERIAAPQVNFVQVVINGENWGVYANVQQFNKDFLKENYGSKKGDRWKVHGSPEGDSGLRYIGDDVELYRAGYEIKSKEREQAWLDLINLCKLIDETPADKIEDVLSPILDLDGTLWFLAVDVALMNSDGYWTRASDYSIYQNEAGVFHILPHDMNESFRAAHGGRSGSWLSMIPGFGGGKGKGGPRRRKGPGGKGGQGGQTLSSGELTLDPLVNIDNPRFPLRQKLLANPKLRTRYLQHIRTIAEVTLNWDNMGPQVAQMRELITEDVAQDTRNLNTFSAFKAATSDADPAVPGSLREFCEKRAQFLLNHSDIKSLPTEPVELDSSQAKTTVQTTVNKTEDKDQQTPQQGHTD